MDDTYLIFGFGLAVTIVVGSGLTSVIVAKNRFRERRRRILERRRERQEDAAPGWA